MSSSPASTKPFDLRACARPNILALQPYRPPRYDVNKIDCVLLDTNESPYGLELIIDSHDSLREKEFLSLNRYPDPHHVELKQLLCNVRSGLTPENISLGVGSNQIIDALVRCFCIPGHDKILICPPAYGIYSISARINDVGIVEVPLDFVNGFNLRADAVIEILSADASIKIVFICTPGNPTGKSISQSNIGKLLTHRSWNGIVVVDEAYIEYAPDAPSLAPKVTEHPNMVVLQTLSKGFGLAGMRIGFAFSDPEIIRLLNNVKAPYDIPSPMARLACRALQPQNLCLLTSFRENVVRQRSRLLSELSSIERVHVLGGSESNFLLVQMLDKPTTEGGTPDNRVALMVHERFLMNGVLVRFLGDEPGCLGALRITVGTEEEVDRFVRELRIMFRDL